MAETMLNYLEQQAVRWLVNRGYLVIKQPFIGMCLGGANADHVSRSTQHDAYVVVIPRGGKIIALNSSVITASGGSGGAEGPT